MLPNLIIREIRELKVKPCVVIADKKAQTRCSRVSIEWLHFLVLRLLKSAGKEVNIMPNKEQHKVVTHGNVDVSKLNEQQQKTFYISLLTRILTLVKEQKENEEV